LLARTPGFRDIGRDSREPGGATIAADGPQRSRQAGFRDARASGDIRPLSKVGTSGLGRTGNISGVPLLPVYGHAALRRRLAGRALDGALPASLLLHGPRGVGKQRLALWLGQLLLCEAPTPEGPCGACRHCGYATDLTHPDLHWFFPRPRLKDADASTADVLDDYRQARAERVAAGGVHAGTSGSEGLYVATMRAVVQQACMSPAMARRKVFVIGDAERMVPQEGADAAANAFLKLLEEPPADTTLVLTSSEPGALLPTIRSRVVAVRVAPLPAADLRAFLGDAAVVRAIGPSEGAQLEGRQRTAAGAPGVLLAAADQRHAAEHARQLLDALGADRSLRYKAALAQGATKARGAFTDTLDALTVALHGGAREAIARGRPQRALAAARGVDAVERAKERAAGNVNPQLVAAAMLRELDEASR
jgi:DNA polymerase III subunit delta'